MIRWLHISDLHFKPGLDSDSDQSTMQRALLNDCRIHKIQADFVVATGDFHNFWDKKDYKTAVSFLQRLSKELQLDLEKDFFLVPGNHDINDDLYPSDRNGSIAELLQEAPPTEKGNPESEPDLAQAMSNSRTTISDLLKAFGDYSAMAKELLGNAYIGKEYRPEDVHVRTWRDKINLFHLNTALLSNGDRSHPEAVDICAACGDSIWNGIDQGLPTLVLGHHSFFDLASSQRLRLVHMFNQHNVWAYLAGDQHRANFNDDHDYYINRKQDAYKTWPNILADKLAASTDDTYSRFGVVCYEWDEHREFSVRHLRWDREGSGLALTDCPDSVRHFPMYAHVSSSLYFDLMDQIHITRQSHPSFQLMTIDSSLYPKGFQQFKIDPHGTLEGNRQSKPLAEILKESWRAGRQNHLFLEGEGGIGKTVALLSLTTTQGMLPRDVPAVYVPLHQLQVSREWNSIDHYLLEYVLACDAERFRELKSLAAEKWASGPHLVMLMDGFNEVAQDIARRVAEDIEIWGKKQGVQMIVASRFDISRYMGLDGAISIKLTELSSDTVRDYLQKIHMPAPSDGSPIWEVINYPLMLSLYAQTEGIRKDCISLLPLKWLSADTAGAIIWNYLQKELYRCWKQGLNPALCAMVIEFVTPYIAWKMVENNQFILEREEIKRHIKQALKLWAELEEEARPKHIQAVWDECGELDQLPVYGVVYRLLTQNLNLFRETTTERGGIYLRLMHQRFRDCFAAIHLLNQAISTVSSGTLPWIWRSSIDYYVMNFAAELLKSDPSESYIARQLWEANRIHPTDERVTRTMLELQSRLTGNDFSALNFSGMDLRRVNLHHYHLPKRAAIKLPEAPELLEGTRISEWTFEPGGHGDTVKAIAVTPCGQHVISCSVDKTVRVWDSNTGTCLAILRGHTGSVNALALSPDGPRCWTGSDDGSVRVWDIGSEKGSELANHHAGSVTALALSIDGSRCFSGSLDKTIRVWDTNSGICQSILDSPSCVHALAVSSDGSKCFVGSDDGAIRVWNVDSKDCTDTWRKHTKTVRSIVLSSDASRCFSGSDDGTILSWDTETGEAQVVGEIKNASVLCLALSKDGSKCFSGSSDDTIRVWDLKRQTCENLWKGHLRSVYALALSPDGSTCFSGAWDHSIRVWNVRSGHCMNVWEGFTGAVNALALSDNGSICFSGSDDGTVRVWNLDSEACTSVWEGHTKAVFALALSPDGAKCYSGSRDNTIRVWNTRTGECTGVWTEHSDSVTSLALSCSGSKCFSSSHDHTVRVWDTTCGVCTDVWKAPAAVNTLALSSDDTSCFCGLSNGAIQVWDVRKGICRAVWMGHSESVTALALSPDGSICFSGSRDRTIRLWDVKTGAYIAVWKGHSAPVYVLKTDGSTCFSGAFDNTIRVWDVREGSCTEVWSEHTAWVNALALSPNGTVCVSGSDDLTIKVWDVRTGVSLKTLHLIPGLYLSGANLSQTLIDPPEYAKILRQNGAIK